MKISLCIMCKNEEKKIARCINSSKSVVDEIIVVDTGSTDRTVQIVKEIGAKVFEMAWENDFSKPRNYALAQSTGDWIIFLDADEYFMESSCAGLRKVVQEAEQLKKDFILCELLNEGEGKIYNTFKTIRIFKHSDKIRYEGKIHERICKQNGNLDGLDCADRIKVLHDGYSPEVMLEKNKAERDLTLLLEELKEKPNSSDICYYLMKTYSEQNDVDKTWEYANKVLKYNNGKLKDIRQGAYERLLDICRATQKEKKLVSSIYQQSVKEDKNYPDFDFRYGLYFYEIGEYDTGILYLNNCISKMETYKGTTSSNIMGDITKVLSVLAECYIKMERIEEAIPVLVKILKVNPYAYKALYDFVYILSGIEKAEAIGKFLMNLYNFNNVKDQMVLLQISKKAQNLELYNYILGYISEDVKKQLNL